MVAENLKPCPFCGNKKPKVDASHFGLNTQYVVACSVYGGGCGASTTLFKNKEDAIKAWNRRIE